MKTAQSDILPGLESMKYLKSAQISAAFVYLSVLLHRDPGIVESESVPYILPKLTFSQEIQSQQLTMNEYKG